MDWLKRLFRFGGAPAEREAVPLVEAPRRLPSAGAAKSAPAAQVTAPAAQVTAPAAQVTAPAAQVTTPAAQVVPPPAAQVVPPPAAPVTAPAAQVVQPPVQAAKPVAWTAKQSASIQHMHDTVQRYARHRQTAWPYGIDAVARQFAADVRSCDGDEYRAVMADVFAPLARRAVAAALAAVASHDSGIDLDCDFVAQMRTGLTECQRALAGTPLAALVDVALKDAERIVATGSTTLARGLPRADAAGDEQMRWPFAALASAAEAAAQSNAAMHAAADALTVANGAAATAAARVALHSRMCEYALEGICVWSAAECTDAHPADARAARAECVAKGTRVRCRRPGCAGCALVHADLDDGGCSADTDAL